MQASPGQKLVDDAVGEFSALMGDDLPGPLAAFYAHQRTRISFWSRIEVTWNPGHRVTVRYRVMGEGGPLHGQRDVVAVAGGRPSGAFTVESDDSAVEMWAVPDDPHLPGLRSALDRGAVTRLLADLGQKGAARHCRLRSYRPGRRGVVEVDADGASIYLKVVRPDRVEGLHRRHRLLTDDLSVPDSVGFDADLGVVALQALSGTDLRRALRSGGQAIPEPIEIATVVDNLPEPPREWLGSSPVDHLPGVVDLLSKLVPDEANRLRSMADSIGAGGEAPLIPIHGDFHEAQIVVSPDGRLGLIDVDGYGWGSPTADPATMLGHLHLLAPSSRSPRQTVDLAWALNRIWDRRVDPIALRLSVAAVILGLATGPFRVQSDAWVSETKERIGLSEEWIRSAEHLDERSLTVISRGSHGPTPGFSR